MASANDFDALWTDALNKYSKKTGSDLLQSEYMQLFDDCDSVETVIKALEEEMKSFSKFRADDSKWATLRNKFKPVVHFLLLFNDAVAETASSHAPGGKSILVAFGVLLTATKGVSECYDALVELFEKLESFLGRLGIRLEAPSSLGPVSKTVAVKILAHLLHVFALSTKLIKKGRFAQYMKTLFGDQGMKDALMRLDELTMLETQAIVAETQVIVTETQTTTAKILAGVEALYSSRGGIRSEVVKLHNLQVGRDIKTWLSAPDPSTSHNSVLKTRHEGTGSWFLESDAFANWKTTSNSVFWIYGSPGSGKSVLCSSIIDRLVATHSLAYFYCDFRDTRKQTAHGLFSSLVSQLAVVSSDCLAVLQRFHSSHSTSGAPNEAMLFDCLSEMLAVSGDVFVVIDALDECPGGAQRAEMLKYLERLAKIDRSQLHLLITSRPEADIRSYMVRMKTHQLDLQDIKEQVGDLRLYVSYELGKMEWGDTLVRLAFDTLTAKANGSFRWVACQIDSLQDCLQSEVEPILKSLPKNLEDTYRAILDRIPSTSKPIARRIFHIIAFAQQTLSVEALGEVFTVDFDTDPSCPRHKLEYRERDPAKQLLRICSSLIRIVPAKDNIPIIEFSHFTVDEYLRSPHATSSLGIYRLDAELAHTTLAQMCLSCILSDEYTAATFPPSDQFIGPLPSFGPFGDYATQYWTFHARYGHVSSSTAQLLLQIFDPGRAHFDAWSRIYSAEVLEKKRIESYASGRRLLWAAYNGFCHNVEELIKAGGVDLDTGRCIPLPEHTQCFPTRPKKLAYNDMPDFTPLQLSSLNGHLGVVQLLLEHGAKTQACDDSRTALHLVSEVGRTDVVRLLLKLGANVHATTGEGDWHRTALHYAANEDQHDVICLLLEHGADLEARTSNESKPTALHVAASEGRTETVDLLLKRGAAMEATTVRGQTALSVALKYGRTSTVRLLLERGANIEARDLKGRTPLHASLESGTSNLIELVRLLIQYGANVNARNKESYTPLDSVVMWNRDISIASLLLDHGVDIEARIRALRSACLFGSSDLVRLLLEHGATDDSNDCTQLNVVSSFGHITAHSIVNAQDRSDRTALHFACRNNKPHIVRILLEHGADIQVRDVGGRTALDIANEYGRTEILELLLQHSAGIEKRNGGDVTTLGQEL
ncbi:ankyrin repeat-containing domain protein [Mycena rosella]|uniref:Ankyrin repeat-containing domain protein n=1 Tax=Mycena rosella TaxID=1033263 RepID=A0AAD7DI41_MYCRO|nr:ankyrin repeat-containing domain protein [Mycena rosella]